MDVDVLASDLPENYVIDSRVHGTRSNGAFTLDVTLSLWRGITTLPIAEVSVPVPIPPAAIFSSDPIRDAVSQLIDVAKAHASIHAELARFEEQFDKR